MMKKFLGKVLVMFGKLFMMSKVDVTLTLPQVLMIHMRASAYSKKCPEIHEEIVAICGPMPCFDYNFNHLFVSINVYKR